MKSNTRQSGYTLLFAVLTASLALGVAAFILGVARKQYILSSTARDSMYSFYAADSGIECLVKDASSGTLIGTSTFAFDCGGQNISVSYPVGPTTVIDGGNTFKTWSSGAAIGFSQGPTLNVANLSGCAVLSIDQKYLEVGGDLILKSTTIKSRGYNLCTYSNQASSNNMGTFGPDSSSSRTVERALQLVIQ